MQAYVDKLSLCQGGYCGAGSSGHCDPSLWVHGHAEDGGDVAFTILLYDDRGEIVAHSSPLLAQRGDGTLITSKNNPGPPWKSCDLLIPTRGAGGYSLSQQLHGVSSLHRYRDYTWQVKVVASPIEWITTPEGYPLKRECLDGWDWENTLSAPLHVYYERRQYKCDPVTVGELVGYTKPKISNVTNEISNTDSHQGYAKVIVSFETDVQADARVYYNIDQSTAQPCNPLEGWGSPVSKGHFVHKVELSSDTLWYDQEVQKTYRYQVRAWPSKYKFVEEAQGYSRAFTFTLP